MKFDSDKKNILIHYILEKTDQGISGLSKHVSETFGISTNTVHTYLNELIGRGIIEKSGRGAYSLAKKEISFNLSRTGGDLETDTYAFDKYFKEYINELPKNIQTIWSYCFSEMMNNVIDHSEAENVVLTITQDYLKTGVMISDNGIGIFEKIKNHFGFSDLDDAICELFKGKLTTDENNHSGEGIFFTSRMMDSFCIFSSGKVFSVNKYDEKTNVFDFESLKSGTVVVMCLSNFTSKEAREIFDKYADQESGFTKTVLPLKNIFDSAPVSRSQAKRICNRLDSFREAVLDFSGLDWMGQGFAHQIFSVYAKAHPEIKILPINMNESVMNMYNHVLNTK